MRKLLDTITILMLLLFVSGCVSKHSMFQPIVKKDRKQLLIQRFEAYWDARTKGDLKKAWEYELPYQKYLMSFQKYQGLVAGYKGSKVIFVKVITMKPYEAIVQRKVIDGKNVYLKKDKWFYIKGTWYHKFYQSIFPPDTVEEMEFQ